MLVGCVIDLLANRKLRHRRLLLESSMRLYLRQMADLILTIELAEFWMTVVVIMSQCAIKGAQFRRWNIGA
jgi:hypothetical protein